MRNQKRNVSDPFGSYIFGEGVNKNAIKLGKGSLLLDLGDGDAIHIENFDAENPLAAPSVASFQFADGTSLTWTELLARGTPLHAISRRWRDGGLRVRAEGIAKVGAGGTAVNDESWRRAA